MCKQSDIDHLKEEIQVIYRLMEVQKRLFEEEIKALIEIIDIKRDTKNDN